MKGAIADAPAKIIKAPNAKMITMKGKSQNFLRCLRKPHMSFMKLILLPPCPLFFFGYTRENDEPRAGLTPCLRPARLIKVGQNPPVQLIRDQIISLGVRVIIERRCPQSILGAMVL